MKKNILVASLFFLAGIGSGISQDSDSAKSVQLENVVITGSRTSVSRDNVPLTVSVVTKREIEESSESNVLPVLSERVPGLFITERGVTGFGVANGAAGLISMRGIGGSPTTQVLILLNGNPQFMGIMGHPLADAYIASDVERVEVIRGPASTLYGPNAMGGVINIITKEQTREGYSGNARVMYGSYNTQKYMVNGGFHKNKFSVFASINHDQTDGHRDSSDFIINNGYARFGYACNEHWKANADISVAKFEAQDPGRELSFAGSRINIMRGMGAVSVDNKYDKINGSIRYFYNFGEHTISDGFHSNDKNYGLVVYESFNLIKGNTITVGTDYMNYGGMAENTKAMGGKGIVFTDTAMHEAGIYGIVQQQLCKDRLTLNTGLRYQSHKSFGNVPVPSAGFSVKATKTTIVKGSVAKGYRSPTIRELFMWGTANNSLNPENMINYEAGIYQSFLDDKVSIELTVFKAEGDNLIQTIMINNIAKYVNTGSFSNTGIETAIRIKPVKALMMHCNYSYIEMETPVIATPRQHVFTSITYYWKKIILNVSMQNINKLYVQTSPAAITESFTLFNAKAGYKINKHIDVFIKGENLLNEKYQINYLYPMPGITLFGGINLHL